MQHVSVSSRVFVRHNRCAVITKDRRCAVLYCYHTMNFEINRLSTFYCPEWRSAVSRKYLASCGFYYMPTKHQIRCEFCDLTVNVQHLCDNGTTLHRLRGRNCKYIGGEQVWNVEIELMQPCVSKFYGSVPVSTTFKMPFNVKWLNSEYTANVKAMAKNITSTLDYKAAHAMEKLEHVSGMVSANNHIVSTYLFDKINMDKIITIFVPQPIKYVPKSPQYAARLDRYMTFVVDGNANKHRFDRDFVNKLTVAGFFYTGRDDFVKCYYCGIMLKTWMPEHDPWMEHARQSDTCSFVLATIGDRILLANFKREMQQLLPIIKNQSHGSSHPMPPTLTAKPIKFYYSTAGTGNANTDMCVCKQDNGHQTNKEITSRTGVNSEKSFSSCKSATVMHRQGAFANNGNQLTPVSMNIEHSSKNTRTRRQTATIDTHSNQKKAIHSNLKRSKSESNIVLTSWLCDADETIEREIKIHDGSLFSSHPPSFFVFNYCNNMRALITCRICTKLEANVTLLPCQHRSLCTDCRSHLQFCAVCMAPIVAYFTHERYE